MLGVSSARTVVARRGRSSASRGWNWVVQLAPIRSLCPFCSLCSTTSVPFTLTPRFLRSRGRERQRTSSSPSLSRGWRERSTSSTVFVVSRTVSRRGGYVVIIVLFKCLSAFGSQRMIFHLTRTFFAVSASISRSSTLTHIGSRRFLLLLGE